METGHPSPPVVETGLYCLLLAGCSVGMRNVNVSVVLTLPLDYSHQ